jgi:putative oxidoreductase
MFRALQAPRYPDMHSNAQTTKEGSMNESVSPLPALGRFLLALIFVRAGINKLGTVAMTSAYMTSHGIPYANILVWGAIALELVGGLMLMTGFLTRLVSFLLFCYVLVLAVLFHHYWTMTGEAARTQGSSFFAHLAIMGGMLYVMAFGAGAYSIDALIRRRPAVPQPAT